MEKGVCLIVCEQSHQYPSYVEMRGSVCLLVLVCVCIYMDA